MGFRNLLRFGGPINYSNTIDFVTCDILVQTYIRNDFSRAKDVGVKLIFRVVWLSCMGFEILRCQLTDLMVDHSQNPWTEPF